MYCLVVLVEKGAKRWLKGKRNLTFLALLLSFFPLHLRSGICPTIKLWQINYSYNKLHQLSKHEIVLTLLLMYNIYFYRFEDYCLL